MSIGRSQSVELRSNVPDPAPVTIAVFPDTLKGVEDGGLEGTADAIV